MNDSPIPTLTTPRLVLRAFELGDAPQVETLAGDPAVARFTFVPHPYPPGGAVGWIAGHAQEARVGRQLSWAITRGGELVGCVELALNPFHGWAEIGFWLGTPFWHRGYGTEAAERVLTYAFEDPGRRRVQAAVFVENAASARLLERLGLRREGTLRGSGRPGPGRSGDMHMYAILREDLGRA
ncbi:GNAT family N-acetyltransferase [Deinococcus apachensis]|uniref:GNAT family N-acetyltransferase n=1 Tax=Deinococcus apachensis TaxID=309886 RepID=UPI00035CF004|nr:GNAT family N-acetyltransferase [Deinococcus apachensis]